jgi:hypothetical protein
MFLRRNSVILDRALLKKVTSRRGQPPSTVIDLFDDATVTSMFITGGVFSMCPQRNRFSETSQLKIPTIFPREQYTKRAPDLFFSLPSDIMNPNA